MFAYCLNNPVVLEDASGTVARVCISANGQVDDSPWRDFSPGGGGIVNGYHYVGIYDKISGIINGQEVFNYANYPCGIGTYAQNGCAVIAIYNAMQLLGNAQSLGSIEHEFLTKHGMILWGVFGSGPWSFDNYFDSHGISNVGYASYDSLMQNLYEGAIVVFTVWNKKWNVLKGFHTMAAQYLGGQFVVYNYYMQYTSAYYATSLDALDADSGWLYGYIVGG